MRPSHGRARRPAPALLGPRVAGQHEPPSHPRWTLTRRRPSRAARRLLRVHEIDRPARSLAAIAKTLQNLDNRSHEPRAHQRCRGDAGGQPQHAEELGAAVRLSDSAADERRSPPVRPGRARGAEARLRGDAQHLLGDLDRPRARRGARVGDPPRLRVQGLRRGEGEPPRRGEPGAALGRAHGRGGAAARRRGPRPRAGGEPRVPVRVALRHGLAGRGPAPCAPGAPRPGRPHLRRERDVRHGRAPHPGARARAPARRPAHAHALGRARPDPLSRTRSGACVRARSSSAVAAPRSTPSAASSTPPDPPTSRSRSSTTAARSPTPGRAPSPV